LAAASGKLDHGNASGPVFSSGGADARAADECNVTQPSLTRAIKQLEAELLGDLFRRERPTQLTELGQRMHPLLKQCYEAAAGARALASSFKSGEIGAVRIVLTHSVDLSLLIPFLNQIKRLSLSETRSG